MCVYACGDGRLGRACLNEVRRGRERLFLSSWRAKLDGRTIDFLDGEGTGDWSKRSYRLPRLRQYSLPSSRSRLDPECRGGSCNLGATGVRQEVNVVRNCVCLCLCMFVVVQACGFVCVCTRRADFLQSVRCGFVVWWRVSGSKREFAAVVLDPDT